MKKFSLLLVAIISLSSFLFVFAEDDITVTLDQEQINFDTNPIIVEGRTLVPVANVFRALDMTVSWDGLTKQVTASKEGLEIRLKIDSTQAFVNDNELTLDVPAAIKDGRTMVPLRFAYESTGATVDWDENTRTVSISSHIDEIAQNEIMYPIVDTGVTKLFTDLKVVSSLSSGDDYYGQDAHYTGNEPAYQDNDDGTVTDLVTDLMWQQTMDEKMTYDEAMTYANECRLGGYDDWRIPSIKELFSLIQYTGESGGETAKVLFIDTDYFNQPLGNTSIGEREIDAQVWSSTHYVGETMKGDEAIFGVNFIDGRIKGYGAVNPKTRTDNEMYFRLVRGNQAYGENLFVDNYDGTLTDAATGLMWQMADDGETRDWEEALDYAENLALAGYSDWRLPNAKELQSIVDYSKSMQTTPSPAIDDLFVLTPITDPNGDMNYGFYWTSTTHQDGMNTASSAVYVAFGEAQGEMKNDVVDVHGAGAVRSDPKSGDESSYPQYFGPQGDIRYVYNFVLAVRDAK
ncbi:MAG: DUF1566 domain-containing protein [Clostridiales bacterium]|nr:DUF1566 domain-containing protein [Clostridiales bacterium]